MIFEIGQSYSNKIGSYKVLSIHNDEMAVSYSDGHKQTLSIKGQSRIYDNRIITETIQKTNLNHRKNIIYDYSNYWTLGFLLSRLVRIDHKVQYDKQEEAKVAYYDATGEELDTVTEGVFYYPKGTNQWGNQGVITFHASDSELMLLKFNGNPSPLSPNTYIVSDIKFFYFMMENGFRPGSKQNKDSIINSIPALYKTIFEQGYTRGDKING